jgi:hypothetical protein
MVNLWRLILILIVSLVAIFKEIDVKIKILLFLRRLMDIFYLV